MLLHTPLLQHVIIWEWAYCLTCFPTPADAKNRPSSENSSAHMSSAPGPWPDEEGVIHSRSCRAAGAGAIRSSNSASQHHPPCQRGSRFVVFVTTLAASNSPARWTSPKLEQSPPARTSASAAGSTGSLVVRASLLRLPLASDIRASVAGCRSEAVKLQGSAEPEEDTEVLAPSSTSQLAAGSGQSWSAFVVWRRPLRFLPLKELSLPGPKGPCRDEPWHTRQSLLSHPVG